MRTVCTCDHLQLGFVLSLQDCAGLLSALLKNEHCCICQHKCYMCGPSHVLQGFTGRYQEGHVALNPS